MGRKQSLGWWAWGALVRALSLLHYGVLSRFSKSDEGGLSWYRRRLDPALPGPADRPRLWIHAVSAGESKVAGLLLDALRTSAPEIDVVLSATTYSGFDRVTALAGPDRAFILPPDTLSAQRRVIGTIRPQLLVLVESEYWPAQFESAREAGVPVVVVNATLSDRSFRRHLKVPAIARRTLRRADHIHVQDEATRDRYLALGVDPDRLSLCGNLKLSPPSGAPVRIEGRETVTFGNIHEAELPLLAEPVRRLRAARPGLRLIFVPRYPARVADATIRAALGEEVTIIGDITALEGAGDLVWLKQMGTLATAYAASTLGVVCGTFAPIGGHDLAEPLHLGAVPVFGPHVERQRALEAALARLDIARPLPDAAALDQAVLELLMNPALRDEKLARFTEATSAATAGLQAIADDLKARVLTPRQG